MAYNKEVVDLIQKTFRNSEMEEVKTQERTSNENQIGVCICIAWLCTYTV